MSHSYKKTPIFKQHGHKSNKQNKKIANMFVRAKTKNPNYTIANGAAYKKIYESWDISDYSTRMTKEDAIREYEDMTNPNSPNYYWWVKDRHPTLKSYLRWWRRYYKNK